METIVAAIDETATERQMLSGWCYFILDKGASRKFEDELNNTLPGKAFHGKEFKASQKGDYKEFLRLIKKHTIDSSTSASLLSCTLNNSNWHRKFIKFCEKEFVMKNTDVSNNESTEITKHFVAPLFTLQRLTRNLGNMERIRVAFDSDNVKKKFACFRTGTREFSLDIASRLEKLYNSYKEKQFPHAPTLIRKGVDVIKDQKSIMIQAADVVGNFSTSYIYYILGHSSNKRKKKAEMFEEIFGDLCDQDSIANNIELYGSNDLKLKKDGAFTLEFGKCE